MTLSVGPPGRGLRAAHPEAHPVLVLLHAHPEHVLEAQAQVAVLALEVVPALAAQRVPELGELVVADPEGQRGAGLEPDADALRHGRVSAPPRAGRSRSARRPRTWGARMRRATRGCRCAASRR